MWIARHAARQLLALSRQFPAVLVTGARQTGKTALLRRTFPRAHLVTLDLPSAAEAAESAPGEFLATTRGPIILDEVQYAPGLFRHLKVEVEQQRHAMGRFLMTGSQKFALMKGVSESLAGRCAVLTLGPLSAQEVRQSLKRNAPDAVTFIWRGGYPELWRSPEIEPRSFHASYVATYLERDVRSALRVGSLRDFERFVRACALRNGQLLNLTELARDVGIAGTTAREWLSVLEASDLVVLLEPWFTNPSKRMIKTPKLYFRDTGLLGFLLGIDTARALATSPFIGAVWETFVLNQILAEVSVALSAAQVYFWRDVHGSEIDFVVEHGGYLRLIEAKWAEEIARSRAIAGLLKVREELGSRSAPEHWVACRAKHVYLAAGQPGIRVINGFTWTEWLRPPGEPGARR